MDSETERKIELEQEIELMQQLKARLERDKYKKVSEIIEEERLAVDLDKAVRKNEELNARAADLRSRIDAEYMTNIRNRNRRLLNLAGSMVFAGVVGGF